MIVQQLTYSILPKNKKKQEPPSKILQRFTRNKNIQPQNTHKNNTHLIFVTI